MYYTLQEFMYHTKAWEYGIVIVFVFAFVAFWWLLNGAKPSGAERSERDLTEAKIHNIEEARQERQSEKRAA
jgi:hypothetical protein